jgi:peptidoglycan-associated lipoprotein
MCAVAVLGVACGSAMESEETAPQRPEAHVQPARPSSGGLARAVQEAVDAAERGSDRPCDGGLAYSDGRCIPCTRDSQCPTRCEVLTGRCDPEDWCELDEHCAGFEHCDDGLCIPDPPQAASWCGLSDITFAWDSAAITTGTRRRIEAAAPCIERSGHARVWVEGHTDDLGSEEFNILLSERRGTVVRDALIGAGVAPERVGVIAKGSLEATGTDPEGRARDRRVVLVPP